MSSDHELQDQLNKVLAECACLREENKRLKSMLALEEQEVYAVAEQVSHQGLGATVNNDSPTEDKIALFRQLFAGRDDVFATRWENRNGVSGYSPACHHEWNRTFCRKPTVKCAQCENRALLEFTDQVILDHLTGKQTIDIYPLLSDETCRLLAVDFDKDSWGKDVLAFKHACDKMRIPAAIERSMSGNGGHVWIFFDEPLDATLARKLGCAVLTRTMEARPQIGLGSYDRLFPSQDTLPKGGFGNLIALPLQRRRRDQGNTEFLDDILQPYIDQWAFLSTIRKLTRDQVVSHVRDASKQGGIIGVRMSGDDDNSSDDPWTLPPSKRLSDPPIIGKMPKSIRVVSGNLLYIEKSKLPPALLNRLIRLAAFQNPEFYKAQAMRLPTFNKPRIISCAEDFLKYIGLPRGCADEVMLLLKTHNIDFKLVDERFAGSPIKTAFRGSLKSEQQKAAGAILAHDIGILSATTAFGKTVVGAWLVAKRGVNTLVLVHRRQLMDQWRERLAVFLDLPKDAIGQIGGGKNKPTGIVDIAVIQSLYRKGEVKDIVADYGQMIIDECHHLPAFSFEQVLKQAKTKYVVGLTATPIRKDGHHPIIMMQCGPIRWRTNAKEQAEARPFDHEVIPRTTPFILTSDLEDAGIQDIYASLSVNERRNRMIVKDIKTVLEQKRSPLVLTERREHLEYLAKRMKKLTKNVIVLRGGTGVKQRREIVERIAAIPDSESRIILATGRYIGEGFDDARLDTLFLTMPISWRGTLQQYAGRLHRLHDSKRVVQIYDYVDAKLPVLFRMFEKRLKGYEAIGYSVQD